MANIIKNAILISGILICMFSCNKEDTPYIVIKRTSGDVLGTNIIYVDINSDLEILTEAGYDKERGENNHISYLMQIEEDFVTELDKNYVDIISEEVKNNLTIESAKILINFGPSIVSSGNTVKITVKDRWVLRRTLTIVVR